MNFPRSRFKLIIISKLGEFSQGIDKAASSNASKDLTSLKLIQVTKKEERVGEREELSVSQSMDLNQ